MSETDPDNSFYFLDASIYGEDSVEMGFYTIIGIALLSQIAASSYSTASEDRSEKLIMFDLEASVAEVALIELLKRVEFPLLYAVDEVEGVVLNAVKGKMPAHEAVNRLVADTELAASQDAKTGTWLIRKKSPATVESGSVSGGTSEAILDIPKDNNQMNHTSYKKQSNIWMRWLKGAGAILLATSTVASAQEDPIYDEDVYELSPFVVETSENVGYLATTTLAGTRIKSDLGDLASSISVVTEEFMEDTGSRNLMDLLVYTSGTEVAGISGTITNFSAGGAFDLDLSLERFVANSTTRVRGLAEADNTRNSYLSFIPFDSYNTERVTINRGANNILFGLGSPAGIIDRSLSRPLVKDRNKISTRIDEYGSTRGTFDVNRSFFDGDLLVRAIALYDNTLYRQEPAFEINKRLFTTAEWKIRENTKLRANIEFGDRDGTPPVIAPPRDRFTTFWTYGKPIMPIGTNNSGGRNDVDLISGQPPRGPILFYGGASEAGSDFGTISLWGNQGSSFARIEEGDPLFPITGKVNRYTPQFLTMNDPATILRNTGNPYWVFARTSQILDTSIFNFHETSLGGRNDRRFSDFVAYNVVLEQLLLDGDAGLELAFDHQEFNHGSMNFLGDNFRTRVIGMDVNQGYGDGTPNPNFGRPFVVAAPQWDESESTMDTFRLTGFYQIDLREKFSGWLGRFLGKQTLTGLLDRNEQETFNTRGSGIGLEEQYGLDVGWNDSSRGYSAFNGNSRAMFVQYIGPSMANLANPSGANLSGMDKHFQYPDQVEMSIIDPQTRKFVRKSYKTVTYRENKDLLTNNASLRESETQSAALSLQSQWFDELLVSTVGWRKDAFKLFDAGAAPDSPLGSKILTDFRVQDEPVVDVSKETLSWGLVLHTPEFIREHLPLGANLSLTYGKSENFAPASSVRNPLGGFYESPKGETTDYGFVLSLLDNRIVSRVTWYETNQLNEPDSRMGGIYFWAFRGIPEQVYDNNTLDVINAAGFVMPNELVQRELEYNLVNNGDGTATLNANTNSYEDVISVVSEGVEIEVTANITENWRFTLNAAQQKAVRTGTAQTAGAEARRLFEAWVNDPDQFNLLSPNVGAPIGVRAREQLTQLNSLIRQDGNPAPELREWRINAVTNYNFSDDSRFKGFGIGGAWRWQDEVVIGNEVIDDPEFGLISDVNQPVYGPAESTFDLWVAYKKANVWKGVDLKVQLNVRNVLDNDDLVPVRHNVQQTGLPDTYRAVLGREFFLTTTFEF